MQLLAPLPAQVSACEVDDPTVRNAPQQSPAGENSPALVNPGLDDMITQFRSVFEGAAQFQAFVRSEITFGHSAFVVPVDLTQEALEVSTVAQLLQDGTIQHFFVPGAIRSHRLSLHIA